MNPGATPSCRCCGDTARWLGKLPDSRWFAGKRLPVPLAGGGLYRCGQCNLKFRHPILDAAAYQRLYDNAATSTWAAHGARPDWDLIISRLRSLSPHGGDVLDFGCYNGGLLSRLDPSYRRHGIEINRAAAEAAIASSGAMVWNSVNEIPPAKRFSAIIISDVIEHVPDPQALVAQLAGLLTPDGILIVTTGDADNRWWNRFGANWWYCFYPEHISFLSRKWLDYISGNGFSILHFENFRYLQVNAARRGAGFLALLAYGLFPRLYLRASGFARRMLHRHSSDSAPGNGVSPDHLLVVISPKGHQ